MNNQKKSVGIQLLAKNDKGELVAILQVRAKWNAEKNAPETWPGACQVTAHGKLEEGEGFMQALLREIEEELGKEIVPIIQTLIETGKLKELVNNETPDKHTITYGAVVDEKLLQNILNREKKASFGGLRMIRKSEVKKIVDIKQFDKVTGVTDEKIIAMFPDEKEAVQLAFEKLS